MDVYFGFTTAQASKYAGQWISIPSSHPGFSTVAADATFGSFLKNLFPQTKLSLVPAGSLVGVRGEATGQDDAGERTIFAPAQGTPLPVKRTVTSPNHPGTVVQTMSRWNEAVHVAAPAKPSRSRESSAARPRTSRKQRRAGRR